MLHFLRCRKGPDDIILSVISLVTSSSVRASGVGLLLNDNYHGSWGASIFYNLVVVSTFLCKGSRESTHTHTGWEWGPHGPHWFNSIWQNPLGRAEGERKMEREREKERDMEKEGWERRFRGLFCQPRLWSESRSFQYTPPKPPMHESGREAH